MYSCSCLEGFCWCWYGNILYATRFLIWIWIVEHENQEEQIAALTSSAANLKTRMFPESPPLSWQVSRTSPCPVLRPFLSIIILLIRSLLLTKAISGGYQSLELLFLTLWYVWPSSPCLCRRWTDGRPRCSGEMIDSTAMTLNKQK